MDNQIIIQESEDDIQIAAHKLHTICEECNLKISLQKKLSNYKKNINNKYCFVTNEPFLVFRLRY